jgi:hypothetical protein
MTVLHPPKDPCSLPTSQRGKQKQVAPLCLLIYLSYLISPANDLVPFNLKRGAEARNWWLMPAILANQEAEIRRIIVRSQPRQIICETLS